MTDALKVLFVGAEAYPYAKVGGLGDVLGALPKALQAAGAEVTLILPRYRGIEAGRYGLERVIVPDDTRIPLDQTGHGFGLLRGTLPGSDARVYFIENDHFFDRWSVYNAEGGKPFADDAERWLFYQKSCLEACRVIGLHPDVVHAHDSQGGLLAAYVRQLYHTHGAFEGTACVYTIHNVAYQGAYSSGAIEPAGFGGHDWFHPGGPLEMHGAFNWMKTGIVLSDVVTTVSPTYAREIQTRDHGCGLDGVLRSRAADLFGVLNGVDRSVWSPQHDGQIPRKYDAGDWEGKRACKRALLRRLGLPFHDLEVPLLAFVGRLVSQKGCDLLEPVLLNLLGHHLTFVGLGSGAPVYEEALRRVEKRHPHQARAVIGFDDELAHWIQAAADILLMPSAYEPCGLNQMYAMGYGTVPVVRATGGLADTVQELPPGMEAQGATGFVFHEQTEHAFKEAVYRALVVYEERPRWEQLMRNGMAQDFSWERAARRYLELYERARSHARARG
jgi:starch synthase